MEKDERLEAIQLIREEIKWLADMAGWVKCEHMGACQRVLKREHAALNFCRRTLLSPVSHSNPFV